MSVTSCERSLVRVENVAEDFFLARGGEDFAALIGLHFADLPRDRGALVQQLEDVKVELVDLNAQRLQVCVANEPESDLRVMCNPEQE